MAYKLVELEGRPVLKLSEGKATLPGRKQVWRVRRDGVASHDVFGLEGEREGVAGEPLLREVMRDGRATWSESLAEIRERARRERESLPEGVRALRAVRYEVKVDPALDRLRKEVAAEAVS
jgi:nicotinate phosphoribosyltransferase